MAKRSRRREERARIAHEEAEAARAASARRRRRLVRFAGAGLGVAALVAVVLVVFVLGGNDDERDASPPPTTAQETPVPPPAEIVGADDVASQLEGIEQSGNALGDPEAPFTLVQYSDLVCPACATFSTDIIPPLIKDYVRSGKLRIEFRPFGFVKDWSTPAARYAWAAADQDLMWPFVKLWYLNQGDENTNYVSDEFARALAAEIPNMNADQLVADAKLPATREKLDDIARSFVTFNLEIVPSFVAGRTGQTLRPLELGETPAAAKRTIDLLIATGIG